MSVSSRAQTLPPDLLHQIVDIINECDSQTHISMIISQVCLHWREFALGSPSLWANIIFDSPKGALDFVHLQLERSKNSSLIIKITKKPFLKSSIKTLSRILGLLLPHAHRWRSLSLRGLIPEKIYALLFQRIRGIFLPRLQHFFISRDLPTRTKPTKWRKRGGSIVWRGPQMNLQELRLNAPNLVTATSWDAPLSLKSIESFTSLTILRLCQRWSSGRPYRLPRQRLEALQKILQILLLSLPNLQYLECSERPYVYRWHTRVQDGSRAQPISPTRLSHASLRALDVSLAFCTAEVLLVAWDFPQLERIPRFLCPLYLARNIRLEQAIPGITALQIEGYTGMYPFYCKDTEEEVAQIRLESSLASVIWSAITQLVHLQSLGLCRIVIQPVRRLLNDLCAMLPELEELVLRECWGFTIEGLASFVRDQCEKHRPVFKALAVYGGEAWVTPEPDVEAMAYMQQQLYSFTWDKLKFYNDHWEPSPDNRASDVGDHFVMQRPDHSY